MGLSWIGKLYFKLKNIIKWFVAKFNSIKTLFFSLHSLPYKVFLKLRPMRCIGSVGSLYHQDANVNLIPLVLIYADKSFNLPVQRNQSILHFKNFLGGNLVWSSHPHFECFLRPWSKSLSPQVRTPSSCILLSFHPLTWGFELSCDGAAQHVYLRDTVSHRLLGQ